MIKQTKGLMLVIDKDGNVEANGRRIIAHDDGGGDNCVDSGIDDGRDVAAFVYKVNITLYMVY